ncbi:MAG: nitroreductase [Crocinitomicaceae bacterium]|jgi:nitroreductase|nr:nitroreductase [Crocinitomicaceae bacterium]MDG1658474.1 nitroreductase [Crocinitomicaceae bacterium]MDG2441005.1 nitroreductase [Crocinitomicaceae bacterium]|tara:strand:- start:3691 stop:4272 length:582 start_codon:yes stop_codon:yes gene_type:complete
MRFNLSEINELIRERRTIYPEQFSERQVHREQVEVILNNAQWAPTHGNTQPWRFKVFMEESRELLSDFLGKTYLEKVPKEDQVDTKLAKLLQRPLKSSVAIAVCMERQKEERILEIEEIEAVACAIQNMHLTCTAYGLGGFWSTPKLIYTEEMNEFLGLSEKDKCLGIFYIGYPAIKWPKAHRKPIEYTTEWK